MTDSTTALATALASLTTALATLTREVERTRGFASALEARIAALEAKAAMPTVIPTVTALERRGPELTTFERATRSIRDGQW
jgi:phage shock protein A